MTSPIVYRLDPFSDTGGGGGAGTALDSIADLRAYAGSDDLLYIRAWHAGTFVGGGVFQLAVDDFSTDDSGSVIIDALSRRWRRLHEGTLKVVDFGAYADGNSDDGDAINLAATWLRGQVTTGNLAALDFLDFEYVTTKPLNFTVIFPPSGFGLSTYLKGSGARIIGQIAGKCIVDLLGSAQVHIEGIIVVGDATLRPRFGVQFGRYQSLTGGTVARTASRITMHKCGSAGYFTGAGKYSNGSELHNDMGSIWLNLDPTGIPQDADLVTGDEIFDASYAYIMDSCNAWDVQSDYVDVTYLVGGNNSFLNQNLFGCSFRKDAGGPPLFMSTGQNRINMLECYGVCFDGSAIIVYVPLNYLNPAGWFSRCTEWNLQIHIEADTTSNPALTFRNAFHFVPQSGGPGTPIHVQFFHFSWTDNSPHADEAFFRLSHLFPASSNVTFYVGDIHIGKFRGNPVLDDGGAPSLGIFYPGASFIYNGELSLPPSGSGPVIADPNFHLTGRYNPRLVTNVNSNLPKGSYTFSDPDTGAGVEYFKGKRTYWGDSDTAYTGANYPPTSYLAINNGTLTSHVPGGEWVISQDGSGNFSIVRTVGTGKLSLNGAFVISGTGAPEGVVTATVGTIFERTDGSFATSLYIKTTGVGNAGWLALIPNVSGNGTATGTGATSTLTLAKLSGVITTDAITTAAGASHVMTITNSFVAVGDSVAVWRQSDGTNTRKLWAISSAVTGASTFTITIDNNELANAINGTLKMSFLVIKAA